MVLGPKSIGSSEARKEGLEKITGRRKYVDDLTFPGQIFGATIRSPAPAGLIKKIIFDQSFNWDEFTIVSASDIPGENFVALITDDQPLLADKEFRHIEEPILLIAHPDRHTVEKARHAIKFEFEAKPSIHTIKDSLEQKEIIWGKNNTFKDIKIEKGDTDPVWDCADYIIEGEYETGAQEQMYIEPNGMIAEYSETKGITVWGSMQCPYYVHTALVKIFDFENDKVRVIQAETGGAFGGKEEYPSMIAGHAAMLAFKSKRPVKLIYDRREDLTATTKRHPSITRHKTAVDKNGKILAIEIDFKIDGGAYSTVTPVVLSRGALHAAGAYKCNNIKITAKALATNTPPYGAFRGFGAPQSTFAMERHINKIAKTIGMDPQELRLKNLVKTGDITSTGQVIKDDINMKQMMKDVLERTSFREKQKKFAEENKTLGTKKGVKKGIGLASFYHGAGFTGAGEKFLASVVGIEASTDGRIHILVSSTEMGQGTNTVLSQIAADALSIDYDTIQVVQPDTRAVPNSGPTVASRTVMVVGRIVEKACDNLLKKLKEVVGLEPPYTTDHFKAACHNYISKKGPLKVFGHYDHPDEIQWDEENYRGDAYATFAWAIYVTEVSVDTITFDTTVDKISAFQEVGKVINPVLATGQIEGGVTQGAGFAISEKVIWDQGLMKNCQMTNYIIPTSKDVAEIEVVFFENPSKYGPKGAKGIGELPMDGTPPAIINAVEDAIGTSINKIPMLPEDLFAAVTGKHSANEGN